MPLLLGLRLVARRPRRSVLAAASLTIAVAMIVAAISLQHNIDLRDLQTASTGKLPGSTVADHIIRVVDILTAILVALAAINTIVTTWTTVIDAQRPTALARALGATPRQISTGLATAQLLPAIAAICLGIPAELALYALAGGQHTTATPPILSLLALIPATLIIIGALTAIPARIGTHRSIAETLQAD